MSRPLELVACHAELHADSAGRRMYAGVDQRRQTAHAGVRAMTRPGIRLRTIAARLVPRTMERLFDPVLADLQAESRTPAR